jgi:predicted Zn-dependent peptidase
MHKVVPSDIRMSLLGVSYLHGGSYERPGHRGISHLMEHLMCKTSDDMREQLRALGIDHNAYTSDNRVVFWWSGLDRAIMSVAANLFDRLTRQSVLWTKEQFDNEKKTVLQEYGDAFNDQFEGTYYNALRQYYNYTGAIGYRRDIELFTYEESLAFAEQFRTPFLICEVGQKNLSPTVTFVKEKETNKAVFGDYLADGTLTLEDVPKEDKTIVGLLGTSPLDGDRTAELDFLMTCITGGLESPLYQEIREKRGLSYYSMGFTTRIGNSSVPMFFASTTNENVSELRKVYEDTFSGPIERILTPERFDICHQNLMIKKEIAEVLPHAGARTTILGETNPFEGMDNFTYDDALALASITFNMDKLRPISY